MAGPLHSIVVVAAHPDDVVAFLSSFGFVPSGMRPVGTQEAVAVWGLTGSTDATRLAASAAPAGPTVEIVPAPDRVASPRRNWDAGPAAIDVYVPDLDRAVADLAAAGLVPSPIGAISMGPMVMRQVLFAGPDGLAVVLVESTHRRSSVLDADSAARFSEPHSVVWVVDNHASEVAGWVAAGWTAGPTITFAEPSISDELGLPERPASITMTTLSDDRVSPCRLELMTFDDHPSPSPVGSASGLAGVGGLAAVVWSVDDIDDAAARWAGAAEVGEPVARPDGSSCRAGVTAGGVRFVLESASLAR